MQAALWKKKKRKKGQLLPASGQSEQNVSSVLTSTPSAVLVHVTTLIFLLVFFFLSHIFFVNSHCIISVFLCLSANPSVDLNRSHTMVIVKKKKVKVWSGYLWNPAGLFIVIVSCTWPQEEKKKHAAIVVPCEEKKTGCKKSVSPRGCFCHRTFQLDTRWCGMSFAITALLVILARCHSS